MAWTDVKSDLLARLGSLRWNVPSSALDEQLVSLDVAFAGDAYPRIEPLRLKGRAQHDQLVTWLQTTIAQLQAANTAAQVEAIACQFRGGRLPVTLG